jgi:hypothetical protein
MENGEIFTPLSDITAGKEEKTVAPVAKAAGPKLAKKDEDKAKRAGQVHFKAAHGIVVAFFTLILYVPAKPNWKEHPLIAQNTPCNRHLSLHRRLPPHQTRPRLQV